MDNIVIQQYIFLNYVALNKKKCFAYAYCVAFLGAIFSFCFKNRVYKIFSISLSCLVIIWIMFLLFSERRNLPKYKFINDGIILAYMSLQFLYLGYALLCKEGKPMIFLFLFLTLVGISLVYLEISKRRMQNRVKQYSKMWDFITVPVVILGYFCAKAFFPHLEYEIAIKILIGIAFFCSLIMGCCCTTKFLKVTLIRKLHITKQ